MQGHGIAVHDIGRTAAQVPFGYSPLQKYARQVTKCDRKGGAVSAHRTKKTLISTGIPGPGQVIH